MDTAQKASLDQMLAYLADILPATSVRMFNEYKAEGLTGDDAMKMLAMYHMTLINVLIDKVFKPEGM